MTKNVLVIGGAGYVGARLRQVLSNTYNVDSVDCCWYFYDKSVRRTDYNNLTVEELSKYETVIVLAAHAGIKPCAGDIKGIWLNNVTNFTNLLKKLRDDQLVIYASTGSIYGSGYSEKPYTESIAEFLPDNNYDMVKYILDLEAKIAINQGRKVIGLRFGTVNGWSPQLRIDVMINAMYNTAINSKEIHITNKHIHRAILGIEDLCRAVEVCMQNPISGIYNLASFNATVEEIAQSVSDKLEVPVIDKGSSPNGYDFNLDCTLFEKTFDFKFHETPATIVDSLVARYNEAHLCSRTNYIIYNRESKNGKR